MTANPRKVSPADALAMIGLCVVQVDARIKPVELKKLVNMIALSPLYRQIQDPVQYLSDLDREFSGKEVATVLDLAIESLSPRLRETAYAWACEIVLADRGVSQEEHASLSLLTKKMGLHGELAGKISSVVAILNRTE